MRTLFGDSSSPTVRRPHQNLCRAMEGSCPIGILIRFRTVLVHVRHIHFAVGEQWTRGKLKAYPAGTLYSEPAEIAGHYAWAKDGEVILQVTAIGADR